MPSLPNIPKVKATLNDGNLRILRTGVTPKVTLLGVTNSTNAAITVNDPILIEDDDDINMFDLTSGAPSEITKAVAEAKAGGADNIEVVVIASDSGASYSATQRYTALADAYDALLNHEVQIVVPINAEIDSPGLAATQNFGWQLANFCYQMTVNFSASHGVIGCRPPIVSSSGTPSLTEMETWVAALETYSTAGVQGSAFTIYDGTTDAGADGVPDTYAFWATSNEVIPTGSPPSQDSDVVKDKNGNPVDIGAYLSVVAFNGKAINEVSRRVDPTNAYYRSNGAAGYAGLVVTLPAWEGPTNRVVGGYQVYRNFSYGQANRLVGKRFVPFMERPSKGLVAVRGITGAYNISTAYKSDYTNLTTVRITHEAVRRVRAEVEKYLGKPNNPVVRNAISSDVDTVLNSLQKVGALQRYDFSLVSTPAQQITGDMQINMKLVPAFEIVQIELLVSLARE